MMNNTPAKTLRRLTDLETGSCASVARIKLDAAEEARLSELGLRPGAEIRRLHGEAGQSILIGVGDGRIGVYAPALDRDAIWENMGKRHVCGVTGDKIKIDTRTGEYLSRV